MQNWPTCTELTERHRNLQVFFSNIALSLALTAATTRAKNFRTKAI